jgi:hypothetical protein
MYPAGLFLTPKDRVSDSIKIPPARMLQNIFSSTYKTGSVLPDFHAARTRFCHCSCIDDTALFVEAFRKYEVAIDLLQPNNSSNSASG